MRVYQRITPAAVVLIVAAAAACEEAATQHAQPLVLEMEAPGEVFAGSSAQFTLTLTNSSTERVRVMLGGRPPFDFVVTAADTEEIWRWSTDQIVQAILETRELEPGEKLRYRAEWPLRTSEGAAVAAGRYQVKGILNMDPPETMETAPREVVIRSR